MVREKEYLLQCYRTVLSSVGVILLLSSIVMLTPLISLPVYPGEVKYASAFLYPALCQALVGLLLWRLFRPKSIITLSIQEGGVVVVISWLLVVFFSAWPFMSVLNIGFSNAFFESMSGWTTTGLSVVDVTKAGPMILLWRSIIQLAGGAGLAIITMSAITGPTGVGISSAEGRSDQLLPQVRQSARLVLAIYSCYAAIGTLLYWLAGMSCFDAVNHSFAAVSTGGFGTYPESIGHWNSVAIEAVTILLMILGNLSFITAWFLIRGKLRFVARNGEVRIFAVLIPISFAFVFFFTCNSLYPLLSKSLRVSIFEVVSALTTTGFSTVSYNNWNAMGILILIYLMLIGGGTCSTAGGIKQYRIYLLWKLFVWGIKRSFMPPAAVMERHLWEGDRCVFIDDSRIQGVMVFVFIYGIAYACGTLILCASGYSLSNSLFEFASALGTVGLSAGVTSPDMPIAALWTETFAMFLGRLEFIVIVISLIKMVSDGKKIFIKAN